MRGSKFKVTVLLLSSRGLQMTCCGKYSIEDIKKRLAKHTDMYWFGQRLFYKDKELQDNQTFAMAGIKRNTQLTLVFDEDQPPPLIDSSDEGGG